LPPQGGASTTHSIPTRSPERFDRPGGDSKRKTAVVRAAVIAARGPDVPGRGDSGWALHHEYVQKMGKGVMPQLPRGETL